MFRSLRGQRITVQLATADTLLLAELLDRLKQ
jgi:hypothetical protein